MKYIITGGEFDNKGAEAMTLITISRIREADPQAEITMISPADADKDIFQRLHIGSYAVGGDMLKFAIDDNYGMLFKLWFKNCAKLVLGKKDRINYPLTVQNCFAQADYMIDISGFALSSKFSLARNERYLKRIELALKYKTAVILMPQSFGPFDYGGRISNDDLRSALEGCAIIYAREKEGYHLLKDEMCLNNVVKAYDMVVTQKEIRYDLVFGAGFEPPENPIKVTEAHCVGIIPNSRTIDKGNRDKRAVLRLYADIMACLLESGKRVYLIPHTTEDISLCAEIKEAYADEEKVILISYAMTSYNYQTFIARFDFIIASRYHSIVHAYKECVPAVIIGWAVKYQELAQAFQQSEYVFDISENIHKQDILSAIEKMASGYEAEHKRIGNFLQDVQKNDYFRFLESREC